MTEPEILPHMAEAKPAELPLEPDIPPRLLEAPTGGVLPPVQTLAQLLPLGQLAWEDFERLCHRLLASELLVERASLYGTYGQGQEGIDVYAVDPEFPQHTPNQRRYVTLQARRIEVLTAADLERAADDFLAGKWADVTQKFIYATSSSARATQLRDKIEKVGDRLGGGRSSSRCGTKRASPGC